MTAETANSQPPARLVVVISGRGRNLEAIIQAIDAGTLNARISFVVSNKTDASGLQIARLAGIGCAAIEPKAFASRADFDAALAARIAAENPDWIVLAGYMRILGSAFVQRFAGKIVNIHPSLLPLYKGLHTHQRALEAGDIRHGASVHFVTADLDDGPVIRQGHIAVAADDTAERLAERVMARVERRLYPAALADLIEGRVAWHEGRLYHNGRPQQRPPQDDYDIG